MSLQNAIQTANVHIQSIGNEIRIPCTLVYPIIAFENGYLFYWTSKRYLETRAFGDMIAGNAPLIYDETTGFSYHIATCYSELWALEKFIAERKTNNFTIFKPIKAGTNIPVNNEFYGEIWHNDTILATAKQEITACLLVMESEEKRKVALLSCFFIFEYGYAFFYNENNNTADLPIMSSNVLIFHKDTKKVYAPHPKYIFKVRERYNFLEICKQFIFRKIYSKKPRPNFIEDADYLNFEKKSKRHVGDVYFYMKKFKNEVEKGSIWSFRVV